MLHNYGEKLQDSHIETFITNIEKLYPRYVRDQLTVLLPCCEKHGRLLSEMTLEYCVNNNIFHANDFKTVIERTAAQNDKPKVSQPGIKPLGGSKTQMIANLEPEKSDISDYEKLFTQSTTSSHDFIPGGLSEENFVVKQKLFDFQQFFRDLMKAANYLFPLLGTWVSNSLSIMFK